VKFQLHPCRPPIRYYPNMSQAGSGIARPEQVVAPNHSWNQHDRKLSGIARCPRVVARVEAANAAGRAARQAPSAPVSAARRSNPDAALAKKTAACADAAPGSL